VQILIFNLVAAVSVTVQVAATYSIPNITAIMLILIGTSEDVYLTGRKS